MSDQCRPCVNRGLNYKTCGTEIPCSIPESWYVEQLIAVIQEKDAEIERLRDEIRKLTRLLPRSPGRSFSLP